MYQGPTNAEDGKNCLMTWASVFEKGSWSTGGMEICSTLQNISDFKEYMDDMVARRLRMALQGSKLLNDREIMDDIKVVRKGFPKDDWWWYPERLR